jgi:aryl-alcohol dehydrogenase (NADP+)
VPIIGARRLSHLTDNLAGLDVTVTPEYLRSLDELSAPTLGYPPLLESDVRY